MMFDECLKIVLRHEGGYSNHPNDPGGETMYGITRTTARIHGYHGPMRQIPMAVVRNIYHIGYWQPAKCDILPPPIRLIHFDSSVNSGVSRAAKWLQAASGSTADGIIGPKTLAAVNTMPVSQLINRYADTRLAFLKSLKTFPTFGKGWTRRVEDVRKRSLEK